MEDTLESRPRVLELSSTRDNEIPQTLHETTER